MNKLEALTNEELSEIHASTLTLLQKIGVNIDSKSARKLFQDHGAEIDDKTKLVKIPEYLLEEYLNYVPDEFSLYGADASFKIDINTENVHFATQGAPTKIFDDLTPLDPRDATLQDFIKFMKIVNSLEYISSAHLDLWPVDVPYVTLHCHTVKEWARNTRKPFGIGTRGEYMSEDLMEILSIIVGNKEELISKPRIIGFFNPISPLTLPHVLLGGLSVFAQYKQPLIVAPAATGGLNAPITLAGLLTQTNAEVLSSIILTQLINPGTPVLYGTVNTPIDPRTGNVAWGSIETSLITIASAQMARFYGIPSRAAGCITNSNCFDMQNGFERFNTLSAAAYAGVNYITCAGTYECGLTSSLELLPIDNELAGMVLRGMKGIEVNQDSISLDQIENVMKGLNKGAHFLGLQHTSKNVKKELFIPNLSERGSRKNWIKKGSLDIVDKARKKVDEILKNHTPYELPKSVEQKIDEYIKEVEKRNINEYLNKL